MVSACQVCRDRRGNGCLRALLLQASSDTKNERNTMAKRSAPDEPDRMDDRSEPDAESSLSKMRNTVSDTAERAQEKMAEVRQSVQDKIDENREAAADTVQNAASKLHEKAESIPGGEKVSN